MPRRIQWVKLTTNDPKLAKDSAVKKFLDHAAKLVQDEIELRRFNMLVYGTSHPELLKTKRRKKRNVKR